LPAADPEKRAGELEVIVPDPVKPFVVTTNLANRVPVGLKILLPGFQRVDNCGRSRTNIGRS
jgi:hypothetical protein